MKTLLASGSFFYTNWKRSYLMLYLRQGQNWNHNLLGSTYLPIKFPTTTDRNTLHFCWTWNVWFAKKIYQGETLRFKWMQDFLFLQVLKWFFWKMAGWIVDNLISPFNLSKLLNTQRDSILQDRCQSNQLHQSQSENIILKLFVNDLFSKTQTQSVVK